MDFHAQRVRRRALVTGAAALAVLGFTSDRAMAAVTAHVDNRTLDITGSAAADKLALSPDPATLRIDVGEDGTTDFSFDRTTFDAVAIATGGGADEVRIENAATPLRNVTVDGGAGNDTLIGGNGDETFAGGAGNDFVDGNIGHDVADLGAGKDVFEWDPGDGSDTVDGGAGDDTLAFNGSNIGEDLHLFADGAGGATLTRNVAAITMGLDNLEDVAVRTLGGADTLTVDDLAGTGVQRTEADLSATGGGGDGAADTVIADGTPQADHAQVSSPGGRLQVSGLGSDVFVAGGEATDTVEVAGQDGDDELDTGVGVSNPAKVLFDGGAGSDHAYYDGTAGDDTIGIARDGVAAVAAFAPGDVVLDNTAVEDLAVHGLAGNDTLTGQNGIGSLTTLTEDGGPGDDTLAGGDGADVLLGGSGNDHVDGNIGADEAQLGAGDDTFQWDPGDGSDHVDGQSGDDTLAFNGSNIGEEIALSPQGRGFRLFRNVGAITMNADNVEHAGVTARGGADILTVDDLAGTVVKSVDLDLSGTPGAGDAAADTLIENGSAGPDKVAVTRAGARVLTTGLGPLIGIAGSEPAADLLRVDTLDGDDDVTVASDVSDLIAPVVDLGPGE